MTTKQDYINSILQGLASITLSDPHPELFAKIDKAMATFQSEVDPEGHNDIYSVEDAIEILAAFN